MQGITKSVTMGCMTMVDGELVIETTDFGEVDDLFKKLDESDESDDD
jgi:hypothetical protein